MALVRLTGSVQTRLEISHEEEVNAQSTVDHYEKLIKCVIETAVQEEGIKDPLWGYPFSRATTQKQIKEKEKKTLPKSVSVVQHCALAEGIYAKASTSGKMLGLMLLLENGLRNKEAAGSSIGDFKELQPEGRFSCVAIHSSTIGQGHQRRDKTKTSNGNRICILGPLGTELLHNKVEMVHQMITTGELLLDEGNLVESIPIANHSSDLRTPCSSWQLSQAFNMKVKAIWQPVGLWKRKNSRRQ